uniref:lysozyme n=1 Tax=Laticauda laticaudata TaxID=8630 RepID=A0A8C5SBH5_LATLA
LISSTILFLICFFSTKLPCRCQSVHHFLPSGVCLAYFASGFNTGKVTQNIDGSTEYGIFQINSRSWCADQQSTSRNLCSLSCRGKCSFKNIHVKSLFLHETVSILHPTIWALILPTSDERLNQP